MGTRKSLSNLILLALEKSVDGVVRYNDFIHKPGYYAHGDGWGYPLKKSALSHAFRRLREKGLIDFVTDDQLVYKLTDPGREKAMLAKLRLENGKWDGNWRLVIFDIPEKRRAARDLLRSKLKQWEFIKFQHSVWATKKNCTEELRKFIKSVGIEDWVMVVESNNISR